MGSRYEQCRYSAVGIRGVVADPVPVLEGAAGLIKDLPVLPQSTDGVHHRADDYRLAAFATKDCVTVISLAFGSKVVKIIPALDDIQPPEIPLIAWRKVIDTS